MSNDTGGPAFPALARYDRSAQLQSALQQDGMNLRDYFAAKVMPGLMARNWSSHTGTDEELIGVWAQSSYAVADALLKARGA
jgi:hypothetical protein